MAQGPHGVQIRKPVIVMKIDIVILDHETEMVTIAKADQTVIDEFYGNSIERYIVECLDFKLSQVSWMSGTGISVEIFGGIPNGGLSVTQEDYADAQD